MSLINSKACGVSVLAVLCQPWKWKRCASWKIMMVGIAMMTASLFHMIHLNLVEHTREDQRREKTDFAALHGLLPLIEQSTKQMQQTLSDAATIPENEESQLHRSTTRGRVQTPRNTHANSKDSERSINDGRPDLDSLVHNETNEIIGDVQFLLDFAIVGFGKCGTSTMMHWLADHPEVQSFREEVWDLMRHQPGDLVRRLYLDLPPGPYKRGYKSPSEIVQFHIIKYFRTIFPKTRLIIGLRNPVRWFESLYSTCCRFKS